VNTQESEANNGNNIIPNSNSQEKLRTICQLGNYDEKKARKESALSYKLSLKVKQNSECRICSSHQTAMVSQHFD